MCSQLVREHHSLYQKFKAVVPPACQCGRTAIFIDSHRLFKCAHCLKPGHSISLEAIDLQPCDIDFGQEARRKACRAIDQSVNEKIALLNVLRQEALGQVMKCKEDYSEILMMQVRGKRDVIKGLYNQGYDQMCQSWIRLHEVKEKTEEQDADLQRLVQQVMGRLDRVDKALQESTPALKISQAQVLRKGDNHFKQNYQRSRVKSSRQDCFKPQDAPIKTINKSMMQLAVPKQLKLEQVGEYSFKDQPLSVVCMGDKYVVGTANGLKQINAGARSQLTTGVNVFALAVLPNGTLIGSDSLKKMLFEWSAQNWLYKFTYLDHAPFATHCHGLWVRQDGNVLYSDSFTNKIMLLDRHERKTIAFLEGQVKLDYPAGLAEVQGLLAIANCNSRVLMLVNTAKKQLVHSVSLVDGIYLKNPRGITALGNRLLLCDYGNGRLVQVEIEVDEKFRITASEVYQGTANFHPIDCTVIGDLTSEKDRVVVIDNSNKQVLKLRPKLK